jgi:hypothetical protein
MSSTGHSVSIKVSTHLLEKLEQRVEEYGKILSLTQTIDRNWSDSLSHFHGHITVGDRGLEVAEQEASDRMQVGSDRIAVVFDASLRFFF